MQPPPPPYGHGPYGAPGAPPPMQPPPGSPGMPGAPYYGDPFGGLRTHPLATISLICGILSIPMCCCWGIGFPLEVTSIVCGILALQKIKTSPEQFKGSNLCIAGMICASVGLIFTLGWLVSSVSDTLKRKYGSGLGI